MPQVNQVSWISLSFYSFIFIVLIFLLVNFFLINSSYKKMNNKIFSYFFKCFL